MQTQFSSKPRNSNRKYEHRIVCLRKVRLMKMNDLGFLALVDAHDIAFGEGDVLK